MNPNALKWVEALESGEYKQSKKVLCKISEDSDENTYCCLGVACEVYQKEVGNLHISEFITDKYIRKQYNGNYTQLPDVVKEWLGLNDISGAFSYNILVKNAHSLIELNDVFDQTFEQIAEVIRAEPEGLFTNDGKNV